MTFWLNPPVLEARPSSDRLEFEEWPASSAAWGVATELRVQAECLERGFDVERPLVDCSGVDLRVNGRSVQVKGARPTSLGQYVFTFKRGSRNGEERMLCAEFFVLRGVGAPEDVWWVIPLEILDRFVSARCATVSLSPRVANPMGLGRPSKSAEVREYIGAWHLLAGS